jgi:hypothetical protein
MAEDAKVYKVMLVLGEARQERGVELAFRYRGPMPEEGQDIEVENEFAPDDRRRARVSYVTSSYGGMVEGPIIHARELPP